MINKNSFGFTVIELTVVVAIVGICSLILVDSFIGHNRIYKTETAELNVTSDARGALDDIDNYVRQATRTLSSYSTYTAGSQVLILQIQSVNSSNQLVPGTFDNVVYYLSGSDLVRTIYPDASSTRVSGTKKLASNVTGLSFTYDNADYSLVQTVATNLSITENAGNASRSITLTSDAKLRNY